MLIDARTTPGGESFAADVCIIGAGAAGIVLSLELAAAGHEVLLVESGGHDEDPATQDLAAGESIGQPATTLDSPVRLDQMRLRYIGGTTNHWAGFCRPFSPVDFEVRDHLAVSGWPFGREEIDPFMDRAAEWVRITDADFAVDRWESKLGLPAPPIRSDRVEPLVYQLTFPTKFGRVYAAELADTANLRVLFNANVVNLATLDGGAVQRLDLRTLDGTALTATARAYVLAAGGIENPRLLLASQDADPAGLGNADDLVGRHFTEHLQVYAGFGLLDADPTDMVGLNGADVTIETGRHAGATHGAKFAIGLTDQHLRDAETTGLEIQLLPGTFPIGQPLQESGVDMDDVAELLGHTGPVPPTAVYLQGLAEQELDPESRVVLGSATDALGMARVQLDWQYSAADRRRALDGYRVVAEAFGALGIGRVQLVPGGVHADALDNLVPGEFLTVYRSIPDEIDEDDFPVGMGFHHMCTTRMAASASDGVVDENCRMHGVDNLWVAGSSVFATGGTATPTYTIVALAVRLAEHLDDVLR
ncbi:MAG: GMC family oxidoreductase [Acidimicrobiales bacterium]|nr:GMC family oxidoreductase [Acidimicrobiales bacterium]